MKHLKLFETSAQYESFRNSEDYVLPNVSYVEETKGVAFNPNVAPASPNIVVHYNIPEGLVYSKICGNYAGDNITSMIVDGVEMDFDGYYEFETYGKHTVEFILDDKTTMPTGMFMDMLLTIVEKIELPATLTDGAFSVNCNDSTVKEIIFNSKTAPSSIIWYRANVATYADCVIKYPKGSDYSSIINSLPNNYTAVEF